MQGNRKIKAMRMFEPRLVRFPVSDTKTRSTQNKTNTKQVQNEPVSRCNGVDIVTVLTSPWTLNKQHAWQ